MAVSTMSRSRQRQFRIVCRSCDLVVEADGPSVIYAYAEARALDHEHSSQLEVEYATRGGWSRVGGPIRTTVLEPVRESVFDEPDEYES